MKSQCACLFLAASLLAACSSSDDDERGDAGVDPASDADGSVATEPEPVVFDGPRVVIEPDDEAAYLFDQNELRTYELVIPEADLASIDANPRAEEYVVGTLRFEDQEVTPVGVRYKGSVGAWIGCLEGADLFSAAGPKTCTKLSMKVKINWEDDTQLFYGLKKLQFHSGNLDSSQLRDRLMYQLFEDMGVPAPRAVHVRLLINGEFSGLYTLVEQIDGRFTRSRFADGKGNLYKEVWPITAGMASSEEALRLGLKTNENDGDTGAPVDKLQQFGGKVSMAPAGERLDLVSDWMDMDLMMRYVVVDRGALNDDGVYHWYCGMGGACDPHNFFWYEETQSDRVYLIPWDMDSAMNLTSPVTQIGDEWDATSNMCQPFPLGQFGLTQLSAACDPILGSFVDLQSEFDSLAEDFLDGPFSEESMLGRMETWSEQISDTMAEAQAAHSDAVSERAWVNGVETLKVNLSEMRRRLQARLGREQETPYLPMLMPLMCGDNACADDGCCTVDGTGVAGDPSEFLGREAGQCGVDLAAFGGVGCVQLDQPGDLDPACPDTTGGSGTKPGCCTDQGFCGSMDNSLGRGCYYRSGTPGAACGT